MNKRRAVITGYGLITPLGKDAIETFDKASKGISGIDYIKSFDTTGLPCTIGGEVKNEWISDLENSRFSKYASRGCLLLLRAVQEAYEQAGLKEITNTSQIGISIGCHGDNPKVKDMVFVHKFYDGKGNWDYHKLQKAGGYSFLNFMKRKPDIVTSIIAHKFDCKGLNIVTVSACSAGAQAIGEAYKAVIDGRCKVMITGGAESIIDFFGYLGFTLLKALAERYSSPQGASRPFDRKRSGFVMSEGAGVLILEDYEHATTRGAKIYGEVLGYGSSTDAYRITDMHPQGLGAVIAMKKAIADAGLTTNDIDYINAHGTSTIQNDITETLAIKQVFGERAREIPISSNKSMLGHTIAGAGAIEAVLTIMGMNNSIILATINYEFPDPKCDLYYVPNKAIMKEHKIALSNSFGFGGQNACLCLGKFLS